MTLFRSRSLVALVLLLAGGGTFAQAVADPPTGGSFTAPGTAPPAAGSSLGRPGVAATVPAPRPAADPRVPAGATISGTGVRPSPEASPRSGGVAPTRPSEFQKFVEGATGRLLPVFGAGFFTDANGGLSTRDNVPVSGDYEVGPGDELVIRAWGSIDVDYRSTVDRNGQISLPKVGSFSVAGVKASELERHLRAQIGRLYTNFSLNVTLGQLRGVKVFVVGPAQRPGGLTLASPATLLSAVVAAGGPAPHGSMRKVVLKREGRVLSELDVYDFLVQGDKSRDVQLAAGDVVLFQPVGPRVALSGALDVPAIYELKGSEEPVRDVLRYAGGAPVLANPHRAQLERIDPTQARAARFVEEFRLDTAGLAKLLRDGDVLTLLAISPQFANAVTLKGHVAQPLRYPYRAAMRIRDLIPDRDALIAPDFYRRKNLLVQTIDDEDDDAEVAAARSGRKRDADRAALSRARKAPTPLFDELNWDYAVVERLNERDLTTQVIPFNLGKAVLQGDAASNIELFPGDVVTVYSQKDIRVPMARQTRLVALEGEVAAPGVYPLLPGETLKGLLARIGGFTPQAYVYGLEFSREETRQRQRENLAEAIARLEALSATQNARTLANLRDEVGAATAAAINNTATQAQLTRLSRVQPNGRIALELEPNASSLDALPDVPLEHGDRIVVPARPGFVTVVGAVANNNAYLWRSGRTAGDYLRLAGVDEAADPSNMFILRADGTVTHAGDRRGLFGRSGLESQPMQPGDALIVPNQLDFETWGRGLVRGLKDWSQILSQFGLGAVALKSLGI